MELVKKQQDELRDSVRTLKHKINDLENQNHRMEAMLSALVKHHELTVDYHAERYWARARVVCGTKNKWLTRAHEYCLDWAVCKATNHFKRI